MNLLPCFEGCVRMSHAVRTLAGAAAANSHRHKVEVAYLLVNRCASVCTAVDRPFKHSV